MQISRGLAPGASGCPSCAGGAPDPLLKDPLRTVAALGRRFSGRPRGLERAAGGLLNQVGGQPSAQAQQLAQLLYHLVSAMKQGQLGDFQQGLGPKGGLRCLCGQGGPSGGPFGAGGPVDYGNARPFGARGQANVMQALKAPPAAFQNQVSGFGQGQEGNCSAIAVIKAAMDKKGAGALAGVQAQGDGFSVTMRDGAQVSLTGAELSQARFAANLKGPNSPAKAYAELMYAAMAKRAQVEGHEGARTFPQALGALANGDNPYASAHLAGLSNEIRPVDPMTLGGQDGVVAWNDVHAMFVNKDPNFGHVADRYGSPYAFDGSDTRGGRLTHAFAIV